MIIVSSNKHLKKPNPATTYLASLTSEQSRRVMLNALQTVATCLLDDGANCVEDITHITWQNIRYEHVQIIKARLHERYSPSSTNRMLSALRGVMREAWRLGYIDSDTFQRVLDVANIRAQTLPSGRNLTTGEILSLATVCMTDVYPQRGIRDASIIGILYVCGMRRGEVAKLRYEDYHADEMSLRVNGKGNKQRRVYLNTGASQALEDWLEYRGDEVGAMFLPMQKNGTIIRQSQPEGLRGINAQTVYDIIKRRSEQARIQTLSPHDLRRTFVSDLLDRGVDLSTVQKMAGHASLNTTALYDRRDDRSKQVACQKLHFPYTQSKRP